MDKKTYTTVDCQFDKMVDAFAWRLCIGLGKRQDQFLDIKNSFILSKSNFHSVLFDQQYRLGFYSSDLQLFDQQQYRLGFYSSDLQRVCLFNCHTEDSLYFGGMSILAKIGKKWDKFRFEYSRLEQFSKYNGYAKLNMLDIPVDGKKRLVSYMENCSDCIDVSTVHGNSIKIFRPNETIEQILIEKDLKLL